MELFFELHSTAVYHDVDEWNMRSQLERAIEALKHIYSGGRVWGYGGGCVVGTWSSSVNSTVPEYTIWRRGGYRCMRPPGTHENGAEAHSLWWVVLGQRGEMRGWSAELLCEFRSYTGVPAQANGCGWAMERE